MHPDIEAKGTERLAGASVARGIAVGHGPPHDLAEAADAEQFNAPARVVKGLPEPLRHLVGRAVVKDEG